ncbi:MAG: DUF2905 family protein [Ardenticatenaceae bacterium]|nr:DUF2905 family protein [Ardenticatenaceae bacterium]HBY92683.1 DUF2905 domain-containing protein [Chloroflexota bacterium]
MQPLSEIGRWLLLVGLILVLIGGLLLLLGRVPGLGRLPGDFVWERGNIKIFAPVGTMLLLSIILTILLNLIVRWLR